MAWTSYFATGFNSKTAGTSITGQYTNGVPGAAANAYAVVVLIALDNVQTTDGNTSLVTAVTDDLGLTYTKIGEYTTGQGGAGSGATVAAWFADGTIAIPASSTRIVTITHGSVTARAGYVSYFNRTSTTLPVKVIGTPATLADTAADPGSLTVSGLSSTAYLFIRATALETASGTAITVTAGWTNTPGAATGGTTGGAANTNVSLATEHLISTATSATSDFTVTAADCASILFCLKEGAAVASFPPIVPAMAVMRPHLAR